MAGAGGLGDAASVRLARMRGPLEELRAIGRVLPRAEADRRGALHDRIVELAGPRPDDVAGELATWPDLVPERVRDGVVAAWIRGGEEHRFPTTWANLRTPAAARVGYAAHGQDAALVRAILVALRTARPAPGFGLGAVAFLEDRLRLSGRPTTDLDGDLELLARVLPPGQAGRIAIWQVMLGEGGLRFAGEAEARRRWRIAVDAGVEAAGPRLAHSYAKQGREFLRTRNPAAAVMKYALAHRLTGDIQYRLGELIALVVEGDGEQAELAAQLEELAPGHPEATLWAGLARVAAGDLQAGAALLRRAEYRLDEPRRREVARLAQLAELDRDRLRALGRSLLDEHGGDWARHVPCPPDRVVSAVADPADADVELLDGLLAGFPETVSLGRAARERAAHAVLTAVMTDTDPNPAPDPAVITTGTVLARLGLAERLLAEDE